MNDRIRDFMTEAGISVEYVTNTKQIVLLEKFAELIVRECMEWCDAHATIDGKAHQIRDSIKNHFGVKE